MYEIKLYLPQNKFICDFILPLNIKAFDWSKVVTRGVVLYGKLPANLYGTLCGPLKVLQDAE